MLPEIVIVVSGTHWHCVTCKTHNKRTVSLDQHLLHMHPYVPPLHPSSTFMSQLSDGEDKSDVDHHIVNQNDKENKPGELSPISPWLKQLPQSEFDDEEEEEDEDVDNDNDSDEDFVPSEYEEKPKPTPKTRRKTRKQSKKTIKHVRVHVTRKEEKIVISPELPSETENPTEPEQTEEEEEFKPKKKTRSRAAEAGIQQEFKVKAFRGKHKAQDLGTLPSQQPRKRGRPPKPKPPPGEGEEQPPKRPYRKRVPDPSEMLLKIRNVGRKANTRKKIATNERLGIGEKYVKLISKGELLNQSELSSGEESLHRKSLAGDPFGKLGENRNGESFSINQDSLSSQDTTQSGFQNQENSRDSMERRSVRCNVCLFLFSSDRQLIEHRRKVAQDDVMQCKKCDMKFHGMTDLNMHIFCDHEYEKQPLCFLCNEDFKSMEKLEKHLYRHNENADRKLGDTRFHDCRLCNMELNIDFQLIKNHYYRRHKAYVCPECYGKNVELLFYTDTVLYAEHKQMHANSPAECVICRLVFPTAREMKTHMWTHADDKTDDGTGSKCSKCDKWLPNAGAMLMHEKEHKNEAIRKNYALEASIGFPCMRCEHIFSSKSNLKKHSCKADPNRTFYFHCEYCAHGCNTKEQLRDHIALHHLGIKRYACDYCDQRFVCAPTLRRHVRRQHTHEKPYECHICGERFYERNLMLRHVSKHTGIASFMCEFCGKGFHTKFDLKKHVENHTNTRDFVCPNCGLDYKRSYHLKRHIEKGCKKTLVRFDENVPSVVSEAPLIPGDDYDDDGDDDADIDMDNDDLNEDADMANYNDESSGPDYDDDDDDDVNDDDEEEDVDLV